MNHLTHALVQSAEGMSWSRTGKNVRELLLPVCAMTFVFVSVWFFVCV